MSDVNDVLADYKDGDVLKYYMPQFLERFMESKDDGDLDQLIHILRNIILLPTGPEAAFSDTQQEQIKRLLAKFLLTRWNRTHRVDDVEESVLMLRQLHYANPSDKNVEEELSCARDAQSRQRILDAEEGLPDKSAKNTFRPRSTIVLTDSPDFSSSNNKKPHLSEQAFDVRTTDNGDVLDNHPEISDTPRVSEDVRMLESNEQFVINHLPKVSNETMPDVKRILDECQDGQVLKYYMPVFLDRFTKNENEEDLNQLISILRNITQLPLGARTMFPDPHLGEAKCLLAKFLSIRWGRTHDVNDAEENARVSLKLFDANFSDESMAHLHSRTNTMQASHETFGFGKSRTNVTKILIPSTSKKLVILPAIGIGLDTVEHRNARFCEQRGNWWHKEYFAEHKEEPRASQLLAPIIKKENAEIFGRLPVVSDENMTIVDAMINDESQCVHVLAYFMVNFEARFQRGWCIEDLERQLTTLKGIVRLTLDQDLVLNLQRSIVMGFFHPVVLAKIREGKLKDFEAIVGFARQIRDKNNLDIPVREALYNALVSRALSLEKIGTEDKRRSFHGPNSEKVSTLSGSNQSVVECLEEALSCVEDDAAKRILVLLRLSKSHLAEIGHEQKLAFHVSIPQQVKVGLIQTMMDEVWEKKQLIMFEGEAVFRVGSDMQEIFLNLYGISSGIEYLVRVEEVEKIIGTSQYGRTFKSISADAWSVLKIPVLMARAVRLHSTECLRTLLRATEEYLVKRHKYRRTPDIAFLTCLIGNSNQLYNLTHNKDDAEKLGKHARLALSAIQPNLSSHNTSTDQLALGELPDLIVSGFVSHFLSSCPRLDNIKSLYKAVRTVKALSGVRGGSFSLDTTQPMQCWALANGSCGLFETTWYIPTIDFAVYCHKCVVAKFATQDLSTPPECLVDFARTLFLRQDYLKFVAENEISINSPQSELNPDVSLTFPELFKLSWLGGAQGAAQRSIPVPNVMQTRRQDPQARIPGPELLDALTEFQKEGGLQSHSDSEWNRLLDHALDDLAIEMEEQVLGIRELLTQMKAVTYRAQFSMQCTDPQTRQAHVAAFKGAIAILQRYFTQGNSSLQEKRGYIDDHTVFYKECLAIPFHAAYFAIIWGDFRSAVELLDYGRSIIWTTMRGLRTIDTQLNGLSEDIRSHFVQICKEIEHTITLESSPDPFEMIIGNIHSKAITHDQPSHILERRKALESEFSSIVDKVREFPGYEDFLQMIPFEKLQRTAHEGPVIIVTMAGRELTVQTYRPKPLVGHAIIVLGSGDPLVITLNADNFEGRVERINERLGSVRRKPGSASSNSELMEALEEIGELFVKDIVAALMSLGAKDHSRIWWCLTTVFSSFPVHAAMWRHEAEGGKSRLMCLNDIFISSYTPSLAALIQARLPSPLPKVERNFSTSMLVIKQQDEQLATADKEVENIVLAASKAGHSFGDSFKLYNGDENERTDILKDFPGYEWIHLACHGVLDTTDPFSSHFQISGGIDGVEKITIMDILRSRVPNAEFAFLSACHTAELPEQVSREESLHLAAAMQFCGYRSVVGTMWPMNDEDGPRVAKAFYDYMFAEPKEGEEVGYLRSARALNKVTQKMRRHPDYKNCPERWVNFVHIGA